MGCQDAKLFLVLQRCLDPPSNVVLVNINNSLA